MAIPCGALTHFWLLVQQTSMPQSSMRSGSEVSDDTASTRYSTCGNSARIIAPISRTGLTTPAVVSRWTTANILASGRSRSAWRARSTVIAVPGGSLTCAAVAPTTVTRSVSTCPNIPVLTVTQTSPRSRNVLNAASSP